VGSADLFVAASARQQHQEDVSGPTYGREAEDHNKTSKEGDNVAAAARDHGKGAAGTAQDSLHQMERNEDIETLGDLETDEYPD
jgi:hypothetical protein